MAATMDFSPFTHLTFDCYGTLIDWESGILAAISPLLRQNGIEATECQALQLYVEHEAQQEAGEYKPYRQVLQSVLAGIGTDLGFTPTDEDLQAFSSSVGNCAPFPDTLEALSRP